MAFDASWVQKQLARQLKELREGASKDIADVVKLVGFSRFKIQRIERAEVRVEPRDVQKLCGVYGVSPEETRRLCDMAIQSRTDIWWGRFEAWLSPSYIEFIGYENDARHASVAHPSLMPGLLQTPQYMHALYENSPLIRDPDRVSALLSVRQMRQRRLVEPDTPLAMSVVLGEAALRTPFGGAEAFHNQLRYLRSMCDLPNIELRVLEITAPVVFWPVEFFEAAERGPGVVFIETLWGNVAHDSELEVQQARRVFDRLTDAALPRKRSLTLIDERIKETA